MVVDDSEEGSGGSPFSKVELECGLASTSRQGLASSYEFEPPHHLRITSYHDYKRLHHFCHSHTIAPAS